MGHRNRINQEPDKNEYNQIRFGTLNPYSALNMNEISSFTFTIRNSNEAYITINVTEFDDGEVEFLSLYNQTRIRLHPFNRNITSYRWIIDGLSHFRTASVKEFTFDSRTAKFFLNEEIPSDQVISSAFKGKRM